MTESIPRPENATFDDDAKSRNSRTSSMLFSIETSSMMFKVSAALSLTEAADKQTVSILNITTKSENHCSGAMTLGFDDDIRELGEMIDKFLITCDKRHSPQTKHQGHAQKVKVHSERNQY